MPCKRRSAIVPPKAFDPLTAALNITRAELHGVISFYHDFREDPAGRHVVRICRAEACQSIGANGVAEATLAKLGIGWHGTTANGAVTIEPVYCLGLCACGPAAMVDDRVVGRVDNDRNGGASAGGGRMKIYVPMDSAAKALGADAVADAILAEASRRGLTVELVRNGTRGMIWLEPLVEVEGGRRRQAFGPVTPGDVPALFWTARFRRWARSRIFRSLRARPV